MSDLRTGAYVATGTVPGPVDSAHRGWWLLAVLIGVSAVLISSLFLDIPRELKGLTAVLLMLLWVFFNIPIGVAMGAVGVIGVYALGGLRPAVSSLGEQPFASAASVSLAVLPMFIFMGLLLWRSGVTTSLYEAARNWLGWLPGGLAITTNLAGAGLGAASGSTIGIAYAVGRIGIPEMLRAGYDIRLATGSVISAGTIGQLIPPGILLVVYASFAEIPVGPQLLAGIVPGIILTAFYAAFAAGVAVVRPSLAPRVTAEDVPWKARVTSLVAIWPIVVLMVVVVGGMLGGVFTATEAGSVAAVVTFVYTMARLGLRDGWKATISALSGTLVAVGSIMFLLLGAAMLNTVLALSGAAQWFAEGLADAGLSAPAFMLVMMVIYLVLGAFMEPIPMMLLTLPLVLPTAVDTGISPVVFGVFLVLLGEIAIMSPPIGVLNFVVHRLAQDPLVRGRQKVSLTDVNWGAVWYIPAALAVVLLLIFVPGIAEWIPNLAAASG